jgi:hypothetical protein
VFTKCWLAREVIEGDAKPSRASDVGEYDDTSDPAVMWLIEPFHSTQTTKYSGTLVEVQNNTLPFMTMSAFSHFTYYWSQQSLVYVDLQCV